MKVGTLTVKTLTMTADELKAEAVKRMKEACRLLDRNEFKACTAYGSAEAFNSLYSELNDGIFLEEDDESDGGYADLKAEFDGYMHDNGKEFY